MPDPSGDDGKEEEAPEVPFYYGNNHFDLTPWLMEWVRVNLAERHSTIYDTVPKGAVPIVVQLVLAGMAAAETAVDFEGLGDDDAEGTGKEA
jgi:hypothetical protein